MFSNFGCTCYRLALDLRLLAGSYTDLCGFYLKAVTDDKFSFTRNLGRFGVFFRQFDRMKELFRPLFRWYCVRCQERIGQQQ